MRAALTLHTPWAWDHASAVYCIFHFSGGVAGRSSQLLVVGRKWRNRMFSERPGCSPHASSPWAWDQASAVYYNEERKRGREEEKKGRRRKMIVEKRGNICQSTAVTQRERERETERAIVLCLQAAIKKTMRAAPATQAPTTKP